MNATRWRRLQDFVERAADLQPSERSQMLQAVALEDAELRAEIEEMLLAYEATGGFLEAAIGDAATRAVSTGDLQPGDRIGSYSVLSVLGQGGMGTVYKAERSDHQFRQLVAVKLVRTGLGANDELYRRFRAERQMLANINHPNIARLLDGGITADGLPYLVMEYVEGSTLDSWLAQQSPSLHVRLQLFRHICAAIQHAHQNLIVHRDLKPGNLLITREGAPKLLDFGIAKLLSREPDANEAQTETVLYTRPAERLMTPEYASPEQIRGEQITTATDVYSLGVLLYEILTGTRPFNLVRLSPAEIERVICDTPPRAPSTVNLTLSSGRTAGIRLLSLGAKQTDLDRIVLKAMHKVPARRYASAASLSEDVRRYLEGFPVEARPDSLAYRTEKFVRRHTLAFGSAVLFAMMLVALSIGLAVQAKRARHEAASADAVSDYLVGLFNASQPDATQGRSESARDLLDHGTEDLQQHWQGDPLVKARLLSTLGSVYYQLGDFSTAQTLLGRSKQIYERSIGPNASEVADLANSLGEAELDGGRYADSLRDYTQAVQIFEKVQPHSAALADAMDGLSGILWKLGRYPESEKYHLRSIEMASAVLGPDAPMTEVDKNNYAVLLVDMGRYREAEAIHRAVLATRLRQFGATNSHTASSMCNLAVTLLKMGKLEEAYSLQQRALEIRRALYPGGHARIGISLGYLSLYHLARGDLQHALSEAEQALAISKQFSGENTLDTADAKDTLSLVELELGQPEKAWQLEAAALATRSEHGAGTPEVSRSQDHLGLIALRQKRYAEAANLLQQSASARLTLFGPESEQLAESALHLGQYDLATGDTGAAREHFQSALRVFEKTFGTQPHELTEAALRGLGLSLLHAGDQEGKLWIERADRMKADIVGSRSTAQV